MFWRRRNKAAEEGVKLVAALSDALRQDGIPHTTAPEKLTIVLSEEIEADVSPLLAEWLGSSLAERQELIADVVDQWKADGIVLSLERFDQRVAAVWAEVGIRAETMTTGVTVLHEVGTSISFRNLYPDCCVLDSESAIDEKIREVRDAYSQIRDPAQSRSTLATVCTTERVDELILRRLFGDGISQADLGLRFIDKGLIHGRYIEQVGRIEKDISTFHMADATDGLRVDNLENLAAGLGASELRFARFEDGSLTPQLGPDEAVGLLLLPQILEETVGRDLLGETVVLVGDRDSVHILGSQDLGALASVAETFLALPPEAPPLMWRPVMWNGSEWTRIAVTVNHRAASLVAALEVRQQSQDFERLYPWVSKAHGVPAGLYAQWTDPSSRQPAGLTFWKEASVLYVADLLLVDFGGAALLISWKDALEVDTEDELVSSEFTHSRWYLTSGPPSAGLVERLLAVGTLDRSLRLPQ